MLVLEDVLLVLVLLPLLLLLLVLVEVVGAVVVAWGVVLTALAVVLEVVVVFEEEEEEAVVLTRVPVVLAVAAGASGSLSIVPSALLTFDPRLFCMALLCLKTAKKSTSERKNNNKKKPELRQFNKYSSTIKHFGAKHFLMSTTKKLSNDTVNNVRMDGCPVC